MVRILRWNAGIRAQPTLSEPERICCASVGRGQYSITRYGRPSVAPACITDRDDAGMGRHREGVGLQLEGVLRVPGRQLVPHDLHGDEAPRESLLVEVYVGERLVSG